MFSCTICKKTFTAYRNLLRHSRSHNSGKAYSCGICKYSTTRPDNIKRHNSSKHFGSDASSSSRGQIPCVLCNNYSCNLRGEMIQHYESDHDIVLADKECLAFKNEKFFEEWKTSVEKSEKSKFVRRTGPKPSLKTNTVKLHYVCFRDGTKNCLPKGEVGDLREKMLGRNRIKGYCPARMEVANFPSGEIKVDYFKTHVGHSNDLPRMPRMRLTQNKRNEFAVKIEMKIPFDNILDSTHKDFNLNGQNNTTKLPDSCLKRKKEHLMNQILQMYYDAHSVEDVELIAKSLNEALATVRANKLIQPSTSFASTDTNEKPSAKQKKIKPQSSKSISKKNRQKSKSSIVDFSDSPKDLK